MRSFSMPTGDGCIAPPTRPTATRETLGTPPCVLTQQLAPPTALLMVLIMKGPMESPLPTTP